MFLKTALERALVGFGFGSETRRGDAVASCVLLFFALLAFFLKKLMIPCANKKQKF